MMSTGDMNIESLLAGERCNSLIEDEDYNCAGSVYDNSQDISNVSEVSCH